MSSMNVDTLLASKEQVGKNEIISLFKLSHVNQVNKKMMQSIIKV